MVVGSGPSHENRRTLLIDTRLNALSRRNVLVVAAGAAVASALPSLAAAQQTDAERHGMSAFGDLKYPADFKHLDYVNPDAPKGGSFSQIGPTTSRGSVPGISAS